jgi:hypothetical protein
MSPLLEQVLADVDRLDTQDRLKVVAHVIDELRKHESIIQNRFTPELATEPNLAATIDRRFTSLGDFELPEITREPMRTVPNFEATEV